MPTDSKSSPILPDTSAPPDEATSWNFRLVFQLWIVIGLLVIAAALVNFLVGFFVSDRTPL